MIDLEYTTCFGWLSTFINFNKEELWHQWICNVNTVQISKIEQYANYL